MFSANELHYKTFSVATLCYLFGVGEVTTLKPIGAGSYITTSCFEI